MDFIQERWMNGWLWFPLLASRLSHRLSHERSWVEIKEKLSYIIGFYFRILLPYMLKKKTIWSSRQSIKSLKKDL